MNIEEANRRIIHNNLEWWYQEPGYVIPEALERSREVKLSQASEEMIQRSLERTKKQCKTVYPK